MFEVGDEWSRRNHACRIATAMVPCNRRPCSPRIMLQQQPVGKQVTVERKRVPNPRLDSKIVAPSRTCSAPMRSHPRLRFFGFYSRRPNLTLRQSQPIQPFKGALLMEKIAFSKEILKFQKIKNIIYGYSMARGGLQNDPGVVSVCRGRAILRNLVFLFDPPPHQRSPAP